MADFSMIKKLFRISEKNGFSEECVNSAIAKFNGLPKVLVNYYLELGKVFSLNNSQDRLFSPDEIGETGDYIEFYMENQYVCRWCIAKKDLNKEDPPVFITSDGELFEKESDSLSDFLCTMAHLQGMFGLDYSSEDILDIEEESANIIRSKFKKKDVLPFKTWMEVEFYGNNDDEVIALISNSDFYNVCYASMNEENFEIIDKFFDQLDAE